MSRYLHESSDGTNSSVLIDRQEQRQRRRRHSAEQKHSGSRLPSLKNLPASLRRRRRSLDAHEIVGHDTVAKTVNSRDGWEQNSNASLSRSSRRPATQPRSVFQLQEEESASQWRQQRRNPTIIDDSEFDYRKKNSMRDLMSTVEMMLSANNTQIETKSLNIGGEINKERHPPTVAASPQSDRTQLLQRNSSSTPKLTRISSRRQMFASHFSFRREAITTGSRKSASPPTNQLLFDRQNSSRRLDLDGGPACLQLSPSGQVILTSIARLEDAAAQLNMTHVE